MGVTSAPTAPNSASRRFQSGLSHTRSRVYGGYATVQRALMSRGRDASFPATRRAPGNGCSYRKRLWLRRIVVRMLHKPRIWVMRADNGSKMLAARVQVGLASTRRNRSCAWDIVSSSQLQATSWSSSPAALPRWHRETWAAGSCERRRHCRWHWRWRPTVE
jgi:hypothetical protein